LLLIEVVSISNSIGCGFGESVEKLLFVPGIYIIEQEKQEIHQDIKMNVDKVLMPILHALTLQLPQSQKKYVEMLQTNLEEITSPFVS